MLVTRNVSKSPHFNDSDFSFTLISLPYCSLVNLVRHLVNVGFQEDSFHFPGQTHIFRFAKKTNNNTLPPVSTTSSCDTAIRTNNTATHYGVLVNVSRFFVLSVTSLTKS